MKSIIARPNPGFLVFFSNHHAIFEPMVWRALGDSAWLCEPGGQGPRQRLNHVLTLHSVLQQHRIPEIQDIVAAYETISVHFNPSHGELVLEWLKTACLEQPNTDITAGKTIEVAVDYHHPSSELDHAAKLLAISPEQLIHKHSSPPYEVAAIGFSPGFPYLLGLDPSLNLPRKKTPNRVPAGAVAIAGNQAGIYPNASYGGWHILGITNLRLFQPNQNPPTLLQPGDKLKFIPTSGIHQPQSKAEPSGTSEDILVIHPGTHTTIQDLGRPGFRTHGVSPGGASDPISARVANRLLGNPDDAAILECASSGPILLFKKPTTITWLGWKNGSGRIHPISANETLDLRGIMTSSCGIIAIHGGIDCPQILSSLSTDVRASFGGIQGRTLKTNDSLAIRHEKNMLPASLNLHVAWPRQHDDLRLRFIKGLQHAWFDTESIHLFQKTAFIKSSSSDRTATRLNGPSLKRNSSREMTSQPVVAGSIQIPNDGKPIILLAECQTIGGYPQIGNVISADLPALARALPGTRITFHEVSLEQARDAWHQIQRELAFLNTGLSLFK